MSSRVLDCGLLPACALLCFALAARGLTSSVAALNVFGERTAAQRMIGSLARGEADVRLLWGPHADDFAHRTQTQPGLVPLVWRHGIAAQPVTFEAAMAVRRDGAPVLTAT